MIKRTAEERWALKHRSADGMLALEDSGCNRSSTLSGTMVAERSGEIGVTKLPWHWPRLHRAADRLCRPGTKAEVSVRTSSFVIPDCLPTAPRVYQPRKRRCRTLNFCMSLSSNRARF